jgi:phenylacetyl-CoA:acceptor oxidoreductase subunit 2
MSLQRHWDARAALNFILGGSGAGLMVWVALAQVSSPFPIILSLALVAAGLLAVWLEIGRKLRALHVLFNPFTSWMTRESFAALLLFPLGLGALFVPQVSLGAGLAAAAFLYCQARMLAASKGIPAWRAPGTVPLVVTTGLAEGAGLLLFFEANSLVLGVVGLAVIGRALAWGRYRAAAKTSVLATAGHALLQWGTVVALVLVVLSYYYTAAAPLAGVAAVATGWWLKFALVTRAAYQQAPRLPRMPVRGTR